MAVEQKRKSDELHQSGSKTYAELMKIQNISMKRYREEDLVARSHRSGRFHSLG